MIWIISDSVASASMYAASRASRPLVFWTVPLMSSRASNSRLVCWTMVGVMSCLPMNTTGSR